jgi:hypothetical protein
MITIRPVYWRPFTQEGAAEPPLSPELELPSWSRSAPTSSDYC